jgi:RIMS-binding protein 2
LEEYTGAAPVQVQEATTKVESVPFRVFVALFDYNPEEGPNEDAHEEVAFKEGDLINVFGDMDEEGFYMGEHSVTRKRGLVPSNFLEAVTGNPSNTQALTDSQEMAPIHNGLEGRKFVALFDYDPQEMSPNDETDEELPLLEGQLLFVFGDVDDSGFYFAELNGKQGHVPSNFVEEVSLDDSPREIVDVEYAIGTVVEGLFDYNPTDLSPNEDASEEIAFVAGDLMKIVGLIDEDGFYTAEHKITAKVGLVPSNFIGVPPSEVPSSTTATKRGSIESFRS